MKVGIADFEWNFPFEYLLQKSGNSILMPYCWSHFPETLSHESTMSSVKLGNNHVRALIVFISFRTSASPILIVLLGFVFLQKVELLSFLIFQNAVNCDSSVRKNIYCIDLTICLFR
jgi:hypothetical protein